MCQLREEKPPGKGFVDECFNPVRVCHYTMSSIFIAFSAYSDLSACRKIFFIMDKLDCDLTSNKAFFVYHIPEIIKMEHFIPEKCVLTDFLL